MKITNFRRLKHIKETTTLSTLDKDVTFCQERNHEFIKSTAKIVRRYIYVYIYIYHKIMEWKVKTLTRN